MHTQTHVDMIQMYVSYSIQRVSSLRLIALMLSLMVSNIFTYGRRFLNREYPKMDGL